MNKAPNSMTELSELVKIGFSEWGTLGDVMVKRKDGLILFNYSPKAQYENRWNWFELNSRGLILEEATGRVVALPFPKFFNWGEGGRTTDAPIKSVWEKLDGSLGICYRYRGEWHVATRGSFDSEQAQWATEWVRGSKPLSRFPQVDVTLLFEIIYPGNRVVVDYGERSECVLIAIRENLSGEYLRFRHPPLPVAKRYDIQDPSELVQLCQDLDVNREGFVAEFADGQRFKFKGEKYKELHRLISGLSFKYAVEVVQSGTVEQARGAIPDEFLIEFNAWVDEIQQHVSDVVGSVESMFAKAPKESRRDFALWAKSECPQLMHYLFARLDGRDYLPMVYRVEFENTSGAE